jgi:5-oxoprolinase (ATP-hydrolysing) subunit C
MTALRVVAAGPMTSLQDAGRTGFQRYGVSPSGTMDRLALAAANALVGNAPGAAGIEFMLLGGTFAVEDGEVAIAVMGAPCAVSVDGRGIPPAASVRVQAGQTITVGAAREGVYAYLAVAGGFAVAPDLGSLSLHRRAGIGGLDGRPLAAGDRLPLNLDRLADSPDLALGPVALEPDAPVRVVLGPQDDLFTPDGLATFASSTYAVTQEADRMGYRLAGPKVAHAQGYNIVSDGIVSGSVQVPGSGEPIVMMADRQTTGGYPKIATVVSADLRVLAQRRPGQTVRFAVIGMGEAQDLARERARAIANLATAARPVRRGSFTSEDLLALNLAGAAVDAFGA